MCTIIKSPLTYTGGKYKLLPQLLPLFPEKISCFFDVFTGSGTVACNVKAEKIIANDVWQQIISVLNLIKETDTIKLLNDIDFIIDKFQLSKTNKEGFLKLREQYNQRVYDLGISDPLELYVISCYAFNYIFDFNSRGGFNMAFGANRSSFNKNIRDNLIQFSNKLKEDSISFCCMDFEKFIVSTIDYTLQNKYDFQNAFYYCDPPYIISDAKYNRFWSEDKEKSLYEHLDYLDKLGLRFGLSNVIESKDKVNYILWDWLERNNYKVHILNKEYSNCNYQGNRGSSKEIYVTNYVG